MQMVEAFQIWPGHGDDASITRGLFKSRYASGDRDALLAERDRLQMNLTIYCDYPPARGSPSHLHG